MKTTKLIPFLKAQGASTKTNGVLYASQKEENGVRVNTGGLYVHFGGEKLVEDGGDAMNIWLTKNWVESAEFKAGQQLTNDQLKALVVVETINANGETRNKLSGNIVEQMDLMDLFSAEDQALFAELEAASATVL